MRKIPITVISSVTNKPLQPWNFNAFPYPIARNCVHLEKLLLFSKLHDQSCHLLFSLYKDVQPTCKTIYTLKIVLLTQIQF